MFQRSDIPKMPFADAFFSVVDYFGEKNVLTLDARRVDQLYQKKSQNKPFDLKLFFSWKVLRDPYYRALVPGLKSFSFLYEAGFFLDRLDVVDVDALRFQPGECRTPISQVSKNLASLKRVKKPVILLCTGAFSPVHNGHIGMMVKARKALEQKGFQVIGGYFSPSHDDYVSKKNGGEAALPACHRVFLAQKAVASSDWLFVDPWESRYLPTDINFTDAVARLEAYVNFYLKPAQPIQVVYVFGADNVSFSYAFKEKGMSISVGRLEHQAPKFESVRRAMKNSNAYFTQRSDLLSEISSSSVRKWKPGLIPEEITRPYFGYRVNAFREKPTNVSPRKLYVIRDDRDFAFEHWGAVASSVALKKASDQFLKGFTRVLREAFLRVQSPDMPTHLDVRIFPLKDQQAHVNKVSKTEQLLNLDLCTNRHQKGDLQFSRLFALCNGQVRPERLVPRPGFASIEKQINGIKAGTYTLLDDDIASGATVSMLMGMLPERVQVNKIRTLTEHSQSVYLSKHPDALDLDIFDVIDLRDFLFGAHGGGLVIELPNLHTARAPYSLPYISLTTRASLPPSTEMWFSKEIWKLNEVFFGALDVDLRIKDTDPSFQEFCAYLKFPKSMLMKDFCRWHQETLLQYI